MGQPTTQGVILLAWPTFYSCFERQAPRTPSPEYTGRARLAIDMAINALAGHAPSMQTMMLAQRWSGTRCARCRRRTSALLVTDSERIKQTAGKGSSWEFDAQQALPVCERLQVEAVAHIDEQWTPCSWTGEAAAALERFPGHVSTPAPLPTGQERVGTARAETGKRSCARMNGARRIPAQMGRAKIVQPTCQYTVENGRLHAAGQEVAPGFSRGAKHSL